MSEQPKERKKERKKNRKRKEKPTQTHILMVKMLPCLSSRRSEKRKKEEQKKKRKTNTDIYIYINGDVLHTFWPRSHE